MVIWRPVMEKLVSAEAVIKGEVDLFDLMKLNALIDYKAALIEANRQGQQ